MRKKIGFIVASSVLALSMDAAWAESGYFVLVNVGDSSADLAASFVPGLSDDDRSFELGVGYTFNPHLSVRAGYHDFGEFDGLIPLIACPPDTICLPPQPPPIPIAVDVSGWSLRVTGAYPLGEDFAAFASAGVLVWDAGFKFSLGEDGGIFTAFGSEGDDAMYEAGLRWNLTSRWNIQASYEKANLDIESTKLGVLFRF